MKLLIISILGIGVIGGLEYVALSNGINGTVLGGSMAIIGGIIGYNYKRSNGN